MAEELAFQQFPGEAGTAHGDEGAVGQMTPLVNRAGYHALAGAALAQDKNGGGCFGRPQQGVHHRAHQGGNGIQEDFRALSIGVLNFTFQSLDVLAELVKASQPSEHCQRRNDIPGKPPV